MAGFAAGMSSHQDMFLKIDGIDGESKDHKYKDYVQLLSFSFGATQTGTAGFGGGAGAGKVQFQDFHISKYIDKSSPKLLEYCATGKHTPSVVLIVRKAGGEQQDYLKIKLTEVLVSSIQHSGSGGDLLPTESVTLNFSKFEIEYKPQDEKGGLGGVVKAGWDLVANKKL